MIPAPSYKYIDQILNEESFKVGHGFALGAPRNTKTVGFVLFDQNFNRSSIQDVISNLDMINIHSGTDFHFFLCGVSRYRPNDDAARELGELAGVKLYHNAEAANSFVQAFERQIPGWSYDLGFELILVDVIEGMDGKCLCFRSAIFFKIEELMKVGIIERPTDLFGKIVKFAREGKFSSARAFRDELKSVFGINWLKGLILAMFPKSVGKLARTEAVLGGGAALSE